MNFLRVFALFACYLLISSCGSSMKIELIGTSNLSEKSKLININKSNKNDVVKILGETIVKEYPDENMWIYMETVKQTSYYGKKKIIKNNILVLEFDKKGILIKNELYDKEKMKEINFENETSTSYALNDSFSKKFFASIRKRFLFKKNQINN